MKQIIENGELNRLPAEFGGDPIFSTPIIGVAVGNDLIFQKYKEVVGEKHLTPIEMWNGQKLNLLEKDNNLRVVSIVFPYVKKIRDASISQTKLPAEIYSVGRNYANEFIADVLEKSVKYFIDLGFEAIVPILSTPYNHVIRGKLYSNWSERHIAFAAGLGTFGLHEGLITELGCNVRFGSFITNATLEITPRKSDDPYANCLYYAKGTCKKCIERCPANAISEKGHDKIACFIYEQKVARIMNKRLRGFLKPTLRKIDGKWEKHRPAVGCAFCQFGVPCMDKNPMAKFK
ncbi:MAG: hypothetical protein ACTSQO_04185 [Candidatus Helarchaeota archaeon]